MANQTVSSAVDTMLSAADNAAILAAVGAAATSGKLSQFAATSSSELNGVISDNTGTGLLVFGTGPTISKLQQTDSNNTEGNLFLGSLGSASASSSYCFGNVSLGYLTMQSIVVGNSNTVIGHKAGFALTGTGTDGNASACLNTLIGSEAGAGITTGASNVFMGQKAGVSVSGTVTANVGIGKSCFTVGASIDGVWIGQGCGEFATTTGGTNVCIGKAAGQYLTGTGASNTLIGARAGSGSSGANFTASGNVCVGLDSGKAITSGNENVHIGYQAGVNATTAARDICIGYQAGYGSVLYGSNICIGQQAGYTHTGTRCILIGTNAGQNLPAVAQNYCVIGGSGSDRIDNVFFGSGYTHASPTSYTINGTGGSGTNIAGADIVIAGGRGTGTGASGKVTIQTSPVGTSGSSLNALVNAGQFDASATAGDTRFLLWDVTAGSLKRVSIGASDSGGTGFKVLRVPN